MKTTPNARHNRDRAWELLTQGTPNARRLPRYDSDSPGRLMDIARAYDRICQRAEGVLQPDATEAEILASLLAIRLLREKLEQDELKLTTLARTKRITWARIAEWQELSGRQAAERRHLQLSRAHTRPDGTAPRTQNERVEYARERRSRRAERQWSADHAARIRHVAQHLAAIEDLQQRVDASREARIIQAVRKRDHKEKPPREPLVWPRALRECVAEDEHFRTTPRRPSTTTAWTTPTGTAGNRRPTSCTASSAWSATPPTRGTSTCPTSRNWPTRSPSSTTTHNRPQKSAADSAPGATRAAGGSAELLRTRILAQLEG